MLIRRAEVNGRTPLDVRIDEGRIAGAGAQLSPLAGETIIDAEGGVLLPGLHDHHIHLLALAAAADSVRCGPPEARSPDQLREALATASPDRDGWIRGVGYHESVAGELDRHALDAIVADRPVRVQHRSGAMWVLNSKAVDLQRLDQEHELPGVERGADGRPTGRLFRLDAWLRDPLDGHRLPSLDRVGAELASYGVTGVTDATPGNAGRELGAFVAAVNDGSLPQRLVVMGALDLPTPQARGVTRGAVKILLDERALPAFEELEQTIRDAHGSDRPVAIHCVARVELVLAATALAAAGARPGDRIEHAAVAPPDAVDLLREMPVTVVTQPRFIHERGDAYIDDVEGRDLPWLYRCQGLLESGIALGGSTDAPFGDPDPWLAMQAAVDRRTAGGHVLSPHESITPEQALALFTSPPDAPGGRPRSIAVGAAADLCLLSRPWSKARDELSSALVRATFRDGRVVWSRD